jgi:hypothetical protein
MEKERQNAVKDQQKRTVIVDDFIGTVALEIELCSVVLFLAQT